MATFNGRDWTVADMLPFKYVENWDDFFDDVIAEMEARSTGVGTARDEAVAAAAQVVPAVPIVTAARDQAVAAATTAASLVTTRQPAEIAGINPCISFIFSGIAAVPSGVIGGTSGKWVMGPNGLLTLAPAGTAPIEYDPITSALRGMVVEEARTNLLTYGSDFTNAAWSRSGTGSITADTTAGPDGAATMDLLSDTDSTADAAYWQQSATVPNDSLTRVASIILKQSTAASTRVNLLYTGGTLINAFADITWSGPTTSFGTLDSLGNGLYRLWFPVSNNGSGNVSGSMRVYPAGQPSGQTGASYAGWAMLTTGSFPLSPIPTTSSQVTRAADANVLALSRVPWNTSECTLYAEGRTARGSGTQTLVQYDDGTNNNRLAIYRDSSNALRCIVVVSGATVVNLNLGTVANDTFFKVAFSAKASNFAASLNGGAAVTSSSGAMPAGLTSHRIGHDASGNHWNSTILRDEAYPRALTSFTLPIMTA